MQNHKNKGMTFIIAVLIIGYCIGTVTHLFHFFDVLRLGFIHSSNTYGVSPVVNGYWLSLTIIDPVIAFLLYKKRTFGVLIAFINIVINVMVNSSLQISSLSTVSFIAIYNSLGNIGNGLQIALLLFSAFTLPLFFIKPNQGLYPKINYVHFFNRIPIIALSAGLIIHIVGLINLIHNFESLWVLWVHVSMTIYNAGLIYALWRRMRLGYIVGMTGFSIFGLLQAGYAGAIYIGFNCGFNLAMAITISICCLSISALLLNSDTYTSSMRLLMKKRRYRHEMKR